MVLSTRQINILSVIQEKKSVKVDDLAEKFVTTPQTIRKDLQLLAELHHVVRYHGGAALLGGVEYGSLAARRAVAKNEKQAIAKLVAQRIPNNSVIFLNAGTTIDFVADELHDLSGLKIITDNVDLASKTKAYPGVEVIVPGGSVRGSDGAILGAEAVDFIRQFRVDFAAISAAAIGEDGALLDYDLQEAQICQAILANARHVILAVDSGKFIRSAPVAFGNLLQVHTLVTDVGVKDWVRKLCFDNDVELLVAVPR